MAKTREQANLENSIAVVSKYLSDNGVGSNITKYLDPNLAQLISGVVTSVVGQIARSIEDVSYERTQELLERLAPGGVPRPAAVLWGFLREPLDKNNYRLYLNLECTQYVEFPIANYIYHISLATAFNPLGGAIVWIERDTRVQYTNQQSTPVEAGFLQGNIAANFAVQASAGMPVWARQLGNFAPGSGGGCSNHPPVCYDTVGTGAGCPAGAGPGSGGGCSNVVPLCYG